MIKAIKMNDCPPYQKAEISDCKKINYVFGANGSGKSTISSFLSGTESKRYENSIIEWDGEFHERIEVYNKDFRQSNLQQEMQGIFTLGSATIEDIREVERLKTELEQRKKEWEGYSASLNKKIEDKNTRESRFKEDVWNQILKKNENDFQKAFEGFRGSKEKFFAELKKRINECSLHKTEIYDRQSLIERAQTLYAANSQKCDRFRIEFEKLSQRHESIRNDDIWNLVITGSTDVDISALIKELDNSSWVDQGRTYIRLDSRKCPFCQQETITDSFRQKLELFFDTEYKNRVERVSLLLEDYTEITQQLIGSVEEIVNDNKDAIRIGKLNVDAVSLKKEKLKVIFQENIRKINEKISEPGKRITIEDISNEVKEIKDMLSAANELIDIHNSLVEKRDTEVDKLRDDIWATCIYDADSLIKSYQRDLSGLDKAIEGIKTTRDNKKNEIDKLGIEVGNKTQNITSVQPAIDEINRSLRAYGFTNFSIQPADGKENYYCIKRDDGTSALNTLSEGEETFLTFLYFMQRAKGATDQNRISEKKIIVLDDPICSLDSTILYVVSAIIKDLSRKVRSGEGDVTQLFVLTHNVYFHKEVSFIDGRTHELHDVNYWVVRKNNGTSIICEYGMKNPISTSYELLWKELQDNTGASLISVQNTMRRIIENYFIMMGGKRDDYLIDQFDSAEDKLIARSLLFWINDGSHGIPDDLFIDPYTDAIQRYKEVFRDIFEKSNHLAHYNMMMGNLDDDLDGDG